MTIDQSPSAEQSAPKPSSIDPKKKKVEDLSDEDLALKQQLELYVERVQDPGVQKMALERMRKVLRLQQRFLIRSMKRSGNIVISRCCPWHTLELIMCSRFKNF